MNARNPRGFSLVEVAIASSVMAAAALCLGASLSASNGQKTAARRYSLAKSLALRQLELVQERINDTQAGTLTPSSAPPFNANLTLANLRGGGHAIRLVGPDPTYAQAAPALGTTIDGGTGYLVPINDAFHVLTQGVGPGQMSANDFQRVQSESLDVTLYAAACTMDGYTDEYPNPAVQLPNTGQYCPGRPADLQNLELVMFQVVILDKLTNAAGDPVLTMNRMFRVYSSCNQGGQF